MATGKRYAYNINISGHRNKRFMSRFLILFYTTIEKWQIWIKIHQNDFLTVYTTCSLRAQTMTRPCKRSVHTEQNGLVSSSFIIFLYLIIMIVKSFYTALFNCCMTQALLFLLYTVYTFLTQLFAIFRSNQNWLLW